MDDTHRLKAFGTLIGFLLLSACASADTQEEAANGKHLASDSTATYTNARYGFSLPFPGDTFAVVELSSGEALPAEAVSYIPPCPREADVCVYYDGPQFDSTNFGGAGVGIFVAGEGGADSTCGARALRRPPEGVVDSVTIDGLRFATREAGEGAMSHRTRERWYWTVHDGRCLTLSARISYSVYEVYEPGSIERFSEADRARLRGQLKRIARSFSLK